MIFITSRSELDGRGSKCERASGMSPAFNGEIGVKVASYGELALKTKKNSLKSAKVPSVWLLEAAVLRGGVIIDIFYVFFWSAKF